MKTKKPFFVKAVFAAAILFFGGSAVHAQQFTANAVVAAENRIRYAGTEGDLLLFDVRLENFPGADKLQIFDQSQILIFEERIPVNTPVRRYKIPKNELDISTMSFRLSGKGFSFTQSFSVNYRIEELVEIKKVK
jgi:hypothetical protein